MEDTKDRDGRAAETKTSRRAAGRHWLVASGAGLVVLLIGVVVVLGYASGRDKRVNQSTTRGSQPGVASTGATSAVTLSVPDFTVMAAAFVGGQRFVLSEHADKPTLLLFTASWCTECVPELRAFSQLQPEMGQQANFVVLDIDSHETEQDLQRMWQAVHGSNNVWALDKDGKVTSAYGVKATGTTVLIAGGKEVSRTFSAQSADRLKALLDKAQGSGS